MAPPPRTLRLIRYRQPGGRCFYMDEGGDRRKRRWTFGEDEVPAFDPKADRCTVKLVWVSVGNWRISEILSVP